MTLNDIIQNVLAGGLLGALGQGVRIAVGLKKLNDINTAKVAQDSPPETFNPSRLIMSVFTGFVAGALGMIVKNGSATNKDFGTQDIVTIIAIGYSGADFIEGLFNTYMNKFKNPSQDNGNIRTNVPNGSAASVPVAPVTPVVPVVPVVPVPAGGPLTQAQPGATEQPLTVSDEARFTHTPAQG